MKYAVPIIYKGLSTYIVDARSPEEAEPILPSDWQEIIRVVEAADEAEAEKKIEEALVNRKFDKIGCDPCFEDAGYNPRVFVSGPADDDAEVDDLDNLK